MTVSLRILSALLCATAPAAAQSFTSPGGLTTTEGDASHFALFHPGYQRFMQIDDTQTGHPAAGIRSIAFRRDGDTASAYGGARTLDLTVRMGIADHASATGSFATNWATAPTTVFTPKTVNVPDWSRLAATRPAPFDLVLPFDNAWNYDGSRALCFELVLQNTTGTSSPDVDAERGAALPFNQATGTTLDYGCLIPGQLFEMAHSLELQNYGPSHPTYGMRLGVSVIRAPNAQAAVLNADLTDPDLTVPGLCAPVHALPLLSFPLGSTTAAGDVPRTWFDVPYAPALEGLHLFTQAAALHPGAPGIPIALSDRRDATFPDAPRPAPACAYLYAGSASAPTATLWRGRGAVVRFDR